MNFEIGLVVLNYIAYEQTIRNVKVVLENNNNVCIAIIDNCSPNESFIKLRDFFQDYKNVYVAQASDNGGYSKGNNFGVRMLLRKFPDLEYIAIMNPDVYCAEKGLFSRLVQKLKSDPNMSLIAPIMIEKDKINLDKIGWNLPKCKEILLSKTYTLSRIIKPRENKYINVVGSQILKFDIVQGSFFIIKRKLFEEIGLFDENLFMYAEENVLAARLKMYNEHHYAGVLMNCSYIHEHDYSRKPLKKRKETLTLQLQSEKYYIKQYTNYSPFTRLIINILGWGYINIGIYISDFAHRIVKVLK